MAGHSHWANIQHKKGLADKKRGKLFGKLSKAIIAAARNGGGDVTTNLALRYAIDKAKQASMPKDTIDRAVKKGCGDLDGESYDEVVYEGYGPDGVAIMCDILTDNRNRTAGEIRNLFEKNGGNLGATGCVAWMFDRKGLFVVPADSIDEESLFELALESGADDVKTTEDGYQITCPPDVYQDVDDALRTAGLSPSTSEIARLSSTEVPLDADAGRRVFKLLEALEDHDDVQNVTANFDIPDEVMQEVVESA